MTSVVDIIHKVEKVAPILAGAIAKMNPIADILYNLIAQTFDADKDDPEQILNKINSDPDAEMKLKELEFNHKEKIIGLEEQNRESARYREIEIMKATGKRDYMLQIIALIVIFGFFTILITMIFKPGLFNGNSPIFSYIAAAFTMVVDYYF